MSTSPAESKNIGRFNDQVAQKVRHSKEDALDSLEFERLIDASYQMEPHKDLETRFILLVCGRLGLRRGELAHLKEEWIDWRRSRIQIPAHERCEKGRDGGICGMCRQHAIQKVETAINAAAETLVDVNRSLERDRDARIRDHWNDLDRIGDRMFAHVADLRKQTQGVHRIEPARKALEDLHYDRLRDIYTAQAWTPKTENAVREIPFGWAARAVLVIQEYFGHYDQWMYVGNATNRRCKWVAEAVEPVGRVTPHTLRATAASHLSGHIDVEGLTAMFGWSSFDTGDAYIVRNTSKLEQKLQFLHD